ncbi:MAG: class I SAM-dependent methyltransferase [Bradyrhizobium sp.]|uniref:class I SAM-dependent methyltransferase n=1 Tax=Bradyrhizobium sp. TaxID=376 RepID=UPI001C281F37|nr:class I SAM-dependent methyltransferase [Bradyrhizobium sp.]MBU6464016.1 methyltransferase domain-containing protein [Pseudomonadota bacterium]MDE2069035.1 class I SAM-dependent methyltransferase [Bradyrhizobium sp.]MDE2242647.1 class I SAM-dependent methyltransferase [Bradyrhizobium sp.]
MSELFDSYRSNYREVVQSSIDFSGLPHSFFMRAKADLLRELITRRLGPRKPSMLDIGCGVGSFHPFLKGMVDGLSGLDVSSASLAQARVDNCGVDYRAFDGRNFPFDDASFDLATAICVLHHVPPAEWVHFMNEMRRVVRRGGLVCVIEHNPLNPLTRLAVARCEFDRDAILLGAGKVQKLMAASGLHEIGARFFLLLPSEAKLVRRVEDALGNVPLGAQYAAFGTV